MSVTRQVLAMLYERKGTGVTAREASESLGVKYNSAAIALARLHKEGYWEIEVDEERTVGAPGRPAKRYSIKEDDQ